ncbi:SMAD/FHA domain-containing protein [Ceratobasidium sp. AG-I]|nr:SMAD/FHA domain-containing protein [Ceratobasidium sp. AG-I]
MSRRSQSPRRQSPPRRSRRSPSPSRIRRDDFGESRYTHDRDSRAPRSSRDDRGDYKRDDYRRDRQRPREDDRRDGRDDRGSRRINGGDRNDRDSQRDGRESNAPRSRPRSTSKSPSRSRSPDEEKAKPNFANSGLLAAATNTVKHGDGTSTLLKYNEPPEARKPLLSWRLYVFKGSEQVDLLHLHRQSAYLIGRDQLICDIPVEHPSCSKQHAVIQFRQVQVKDEYGIAKPFVKPFVIDLESTNGTMVNNEQIPVSRYYELKASDVLKFGQSTREYVLLQEDNS